MRPRALFCPVWRADAPCCHVIMAQESVGTEEAENLRANFRKAASVTLPGAGLLAAHARKR
jgi:hypothetical protein